MHGCHNIIGSFSNNEIILKKFKISFDNGYGK